MSQQAAAGRGAGHGGGRRKAQYFSQEGGIKVAKPHKLLITEIVGETFNTGQKKSAAEGYLVAETVRMGQKQTIKLPLPVDKYAPD